MKMKMSDQVPAILHFHFGFCILHFIQLCSRVSEKNSLVFLCVLCALCGESSGSFLLLQTEEPLAARAVAGGAEAEPIGADAARVGEHAAGAGGGSPIRAGAGGRPGG